MVDQISTASEPGAPGPAASSNDLKAQSTLEQAIRGLLARIGDGEPCMIGALRDRDVLALAAWLEGPDPGVDESARPALAAECERRRALSAHMSNRFDEAFEMLNAARADGSLF